MKEMGKLQKSVNALDQLLMKHEKEIDSEIFLKLQEAFFTLEDNFDDVDIETKKLEEKLAETEYELDERKKIIWNNKELRDSIINPALSVAHSSKIYEGINRD